MSIDFIKGELFKKLADDIRIFYFDTHKVKNFFKNPPKDNFVLITHNSDGKITKNSYSENDLNLNEIVIPSNMKMWFAQNVNLIHEKIQSLPIGLENSEWFPELQKEKKIISYSKKEKKNENLLYVCHNINTNFSERKEPYEIFSNKKWATLNFGFNGQNFDNYLEKINNHKFVLCPEGNGTDTHRTWETLYMGSIPVEKKNFNNRFYQDLPICLVEKWSDITQEFLENEYIRITNTSWNLNKLNMEYWINLIKKTAYEN